MSYEIPTNIEEWKRKDKDFKSIINGKRYVLTFIIGKGTCLVPVKIIKKEESK